MNRREIREFVRRLLNEADASDSYWTDDQLNSYIQAAYEQIVTEAELMHCTSETPSVASEADYQMPADVLLPLRVWYDGKPLEKTSVWELDRMDPDWLGRVCAADQVPTHWLPRGQLLRLYPAPSQSGKTITVWGIQSPRPLADDSDTPQIQQAYHTPMAFLAAYLAAQSDYTNQALRAASQSWLLIYRAGRDKALQFTLRKEAAKWQMRDAYSRSPRLWQM